MSTPNSTLDWIDLSTGERLVGVLDYMNNRFIHFYNFNHNSDPNLILAAIAWRTGHHHTMRFSVFCAIYCRGITLPAVNLVNRKTIAKMIDHSNISKAAAQSKVRLSTKNFVEE